MNHNQYIHNAQVHQDVLAVLRVRKNTTWQEWCLAYNTLLDRLGKPRLTAAYNAIARASQGELQRWLLEAETESTAKTPWFDACETDPARSGVYEVVTDGYYAFFFHSLRKWSEIKTSAQRAADSAVIPAIKSDRSKIARWRGLAERPIKEELRHFITPAHRDRFMVGADIVAAQQARSEPQEFTDTDRLNFLLCHTHHIIHGNDKTYFFVYDPVFEPVSRARLDNAMRGVKAKEKNIDEALREGNDTFYDRR